MASVLVCGAGPIGLCTAMMLARDGHEVTVVEADPDAPPDSAEEAWESWTRRGVAQFRQPHNLFSRCRQILDAELPGLTQQLLDAGCSWVNPLRPMPPTIADQTERPGDDAFPFVTGRRPVVEAAVARAADAEEGVTVRRGVTIAGLRAPPSQAGVPHVDGVRLAGGEELRADLVVDAMGRRTRAAAWLEEIGAPPPETHAEDSGFVYYTRYFRGPERPQTRAPGLCAMGSVSILTLTGDNDTWSVTLFGPTRDTALKSLRRPEVFTRVVEACPAQAHWLAGRPIGEVRSMAGILDRYRRFVVDGRPVVTGYAAVGDAWACTNPSAGRGLSVGLIHAQRLRHVVREHLGDPRTFAEVWDLETQDHVAPFYWNQIAADRTRFAEMEAARAGTEPPAADDAVTRFLTAAGRDGDVFRALLEIVTCLALPQEVLARPAVRVATDRAGDGAPTVVPGPDRKQLLALLG